MHFVNMASMIGPPKKKKTKKNDKAKVIEHIY